MVEQTSTPPDRSFSRYLAWLSGGLLGLGATLFFVIYQFGEELPPPPFTGSISFDEKAVWLAKHLDDPCEVLAIGSSMTVNNLDSAVFSGRHLINASSWGMKIQHIDYFLETLLEYVSPKAVLVVTAPTDFERDFRGPALFDRARLKRFFDSRDLFRSHVELLSVEYLIGAIPEIRRDRVGRSTYFALDFDAGGGVPLDLVSEGFERWPDRWEKPVAREEGMDEANYESLAAMARRCRDRGLPLVVVQAPIREDVLTERDRAFLLGRHWLRLAQICRDSGAGFHNFHGRLALAETDFADSTHLNRAGARELSKRIVPLLDEVISERALLGFRAAGEE